MVEEIKSTKFPTFHFTNKVGESCGLPKYITCSITYSIAGQPGGMNAERSHNLVFNQILDGAASMVGNSQHALHTPTVTVTISGTQHNNSGKSVCADCYLYASMPTFLSLSRGVLNMK
jgi:hypothetical protein